MKTDRFLLEELQTIHTHIKKNLFDKIAGPYTFSYQEINLSELLNHACCEHIFYFKSKYSDLEFLGLGMAKKISSSELSHFLFQHPEQYLMASFQFENDPKASEFILPEWSFVKKDSKIELVINPNNEHLQYSVPDLLLDSEYNINIYDPKIELWQSYEEFPEHDQWEKMISKCNELFTSKILSKIVLSRKKIFGYNSPIDLISFFKAVLKQNENAQSSYAIFHQTAFNKAFISLTPEKFFSLDNRIFQSISLAASAPRGATMSEDEIFESTLFTNERLQREHNIVSEEIIHKISPYVKHIKKSDLQIMKLPYIQHRSLPIEAELNEQISALDLVSLLHPTPAVGGLPSAIAKDNIAAIEPFLRNSYAAPIGIISSSYTELAVGIRSAEILDSTITIFGGAGIVEGCIAEEEWLETGIKMNPFLKVIHHE